MPAEWRGDKFAQPGDFPLLVKFIFPQDKLSIQVHPDDAYASVHEKAAGGCGKTEMWHAVSAEPGAQVLVGLKPGVDKEKFLEALRAHMLEKLFVAHPVHAGDTFFLPAGTPHTIGPGMVLCEVQQYSDLTYRVYDYERVDSHGKKRQLHIEKALEVMHFGAGQEVRTRPLALGREGMDLAIDGTGGMLLAACRYFGAARWDIARTQKWSWEDGATEFAVFAFLVGTGLIVWPEGKATFKAGECWFMPAGLEEYSVVPYGSTSLLEIFVPDISGLRKQLVDDGFAKDSFSRTVFQ